MGNSESSNPVRNMDKRTARREYRTDFMRAISNYRQRNAASAKRKVATVSDDWSDGNIKVFVRKRPIFKHELDAFEFDVATCTSENTIVIHDARMHNDMKRQLMNHHEFQFDRTFGENVKNDEVYNCTAKSLVNIACNGGYSTCLVYGQTGSGKTFTMSSIYEHAAYDIFNQLELLAERFATLPTVSVSFFEIAGDACHDLLNRFHPAQLLTGSDGSVHAFPVVEPTVTCAEELIAMIQHGTAVRTTAATGVHDQSSRSHAVLRIYIQRQDLRGSDGDAVEGTLTLVDLAGSEHRIDSMYHGKERRKETGNINASLMALKECIRARAAGQVLSFQYRRSKLTQALKCSFSLPSARTIVIATVSPASKDTEHSLNTLRHACIMHGQQDHSSDRETRFVTGGTVTSELIGEINLTEIGRKNANIKRSGGVMDGPKTNNGNITDSKAARAANNEEELTDKDRLRLRKAAEARSIAKLLPQYRDMLKHYREQLGRNRHQAARLQKLPTDPNAIIEEESGSYISPAQSPRKGGGASAEGTWSEDEGQEVAEEQFDFHSSLNKNKDLRHPLDLHEIVTSGRQAGESDAESVEDEVERHVSDRNGGDRRASGGQRDRPSSAGASRSRPGSAAVLKKANSEVARRSSGGFVQDEWGSEQDDQEVADEDDGGEEAGQLANMPQLRSQAGKAAVLHVRRAGSGAAADTSPRPSSSGGRSAQQQTRTPPPPQRKEEVSRPSPSSQRIEFQRLYDTIYSGAEGVPEHILRRQLTSLLTLHGYSEREIEMMFEMQSILQENAAMKKAAEARAAPPERKVSPRAEVQRVPQRVESTPARSPPIEVRRAPVKNSPVRQVARVVEPEPEAPPPQPSGGASAKRSGSVARSAVVAEERRRQQLDGEDRQRRLAEDKERRERDAVAEAAALLEQQAATRKARQDAAKLLREQQDEERRVKAARNAAASRATKQSVATAFPTSAPSASRSNLEEPISTHSTAAATRASIRKHEDEITSLMEQLQMEGNTEATQYALRKNIAVRKAALLRERRVAAQKSFLEEEEDIPVPQPAMKGATRYAAQNPSPAYQPQPVSQPSIAGGFNAQRPRPQGFDDMPVGGGGRSEYSEPPPRVVNSRERNVYAGAIGGGKAPPPGRAEAFGGPRWAPTTEQPAEQERYEYFSPRSQQQFDAVQQPAPRASPAAADRTPYQNKRAVGAASAPFGNDYSWETEP